MVQNLHAMLSTLTKHQTTIALMYLSRRYMQMLEIPNGLDIAPDTSLVVSFNQGLDDCKTRLGIEDRQARIVTTAAADVNFIEDYLQICSYRLDSEAAIDYCDLDRLNTIFSNHCERVTLDARPAVVNVRMV